MANQKIMYRFIIVFFMSIILFLGWAKLTLSAEVTVKQLGGGDYETINEAISNAYQDDTIMVYHGRYEEEVIIDKNLSLVGLGPQFVTIYSPTNGVTVQNFVEAKIQGFTITSGSFGILLTDNSNTIIKNNCIKSNGRAGIYGSDGSGPPAISSILNNTITDNAESGIWRGYNTAFYVINNIIFDNHNYGINGSVTNSYNNVFSNSPGNYNGDNPHSTDISENPFCIDPDSGCCVLQASSPCINAGRPGSADVDPDGSRNDMGVFGGPDSASFWPYPAGAPIITILNATPTSVSKGSPITIEATGEVYE